MQFDQGLENKLQNRNITRNKTRLHAKKRGKNQVPTS